MINRKLVTVPTIFLPLRLLVDHFLNKKRLVFMPLPTDDPRQRQNNILLANIKFRAS